MDDRSARTSTPDPGATLAAYPAGWRGPAVVLQARPPRPPRRWGPLGRVALGWLLGVATALGYQALRPRGGAAPAGPTWNLQVASGGRGAPLVAVYSPDAGLRVVRAGGAAARSLRVAGAEVWMVSLGRAPLAVRGDAGGAGGLRAFGATGRVVTAYRDARRTGVRTSF